MALTSCPARQGQQRSLRRIRQVLSLTALDEWGARRGEHRPVPHPRTGALTDFLFTARGRRLGPTRLRNGLLAAAESAGLRGPGSEPLVVTCHQLRHT